MNAEPDKARVCQYFQSVQSRLIDAFQALDPAAELKDSNWQKTSDGSGGGRMRVLRGNLVEKAGANFSEVRGDRYPSLESDMAGEPYYATGVSTIGHMMNPHAPIAHANLRYLEVGGKWWFGGGADLTPCFEYPEDTEYFHQRLAEACRKYSEESYAAFSRWCDEYFYIPHRKSRRGVGGIFFDYLSDRPFSELFDFVQAVGEAYLDAYPTILRRRISLPYSEADKEKQLFWRGRYAEFNLVYDRGTKFGLMTGGNIEAIFVSLPPVVKW